MRSLLTARGAIGVALAFTVLAYLEHTFAPWAPFYVGYAILATALPVALGTYRFGSVRGMRLWVWGLGIVLGVGLQAVAGLWFGLVWPAVLSAAGVPAESLTLPHYSFPAALPAMLGVAADRLGMEPSTVLLAYVAFIVVWAGAGEELFFRGYLQETIARAGGFWVGALVSAGFFGLRHLTQLFLMPEYPWPAALSWALFSVVLGVVFGLLYEKTRSLYAPILVHYVFNLVPFATLLAAGGE